MDRYAKIFIPLVLLFFIVGEYMQKDNVTRYVQIWLLFNLFLVLLAYFLQHSLRRFIAGDINKMIRLAYICNHDNNFFFNKIILNTPTHIPTEFETVDVNARTVLKFSQENPYLYDISHTVYDRKFLRFSWLKLKIEDKENFIENLKPGDIILYHKKNSILGIAIRFFTRNYWEHTAAYISDGQIVDVAPGGIKKVPISPWLRDKAVELSVLRVNSELPADKFIHLIEEKIGSGYAYLKVFIVWWQIVTGKTRLCLLNPLIVSLNIIQILSAEILTFISPSYTRIQIASILITAPYMFGSVYHRIAYRRDFRLILGDDNEKSGN